MKLLNIDNNFETINLDKDLWREYQYYSKKSNLYNLRIEPYINRCLKYISIFGVEGFISILKICVQRIIYKIYKN